MYARNVSMHLKANTAGEFTQTLEKDVLPLLRKQNGFKDEISFVASEFRTRPSTGSPQGTRADRSVRRPLVAPVCFKADRSLQRRGAAEESALLSRP